MIYTVTLLHSWDSNELTQVTNVIFALQIDTTININGSHINMS